MAALGTMYADYETLHVTMPAPHVLHVELNRPSKLNTMTLAFWDEIRHVFGAVEQDNRVRAVLLSGAGRMFTAGLDMGAAGELMAGSESDAARQALRLRQIGKAWQTSFTKIECCGKAVIACCHGGVIGGGVEMISACDVRFCTHDAFFVLAEVDLGLAADVGGLQRFPKVVGNQSLVRELALSGRRLGAEEALQHGFVSRVLEDKEQLMSAAMEFAKQVAAKSPIATMGIKEFLNYSRDRPVDESLNYAITWNMAMLQSSDCMKATAALLQKKSGEFDNLPATPQSKL
mmetsp:Transcript_41455/g.82004  ORF Transcript_41455/g.82004 Transcript_41455/m.82004 type:complete len:289 (-) Transcript_41455:11-877(-)